MTEPTIAARAEDLRAQLQAIVDSVPTYSPSTPLLPISAGVSLARMVAELARVVEQRPTESVASILLEHQGPHFNGHTSRCQCGEQVRSGQDWAEHVAQVLGGAS